MNIQSLIERLFNVDSRTSATIIISLTVFISGYIISSLIKTVEKYFIRKANRKIFLLNLKTFIDSIRKRREILKEQLSHLQIENFSQIPVGGVQFFQVSVLNSIGHKNAFDAFFLGFENVLIFKSRKNLKRKAFLKVLENMANIEVWEKEMYDQMTPMQKEINRMNETMAGPLTQMRLKYFDLFKKMDTSTLEISEISFVTELRKVVSEWELSSQARTGYNVNEFLSKKINTLCTKHLSLPIAVELRNICMDAEYWFRNIVVINNSITMGLTQHNHSLSYFSKSTRKIIKILS